MQSKISLKHVILYRIGKPVKEFGIDSAYPLTDLAKWACWVSGQNRFGSEQVVVENGSYWTTVVVVGTY